jgi:hypothetical protein
MYEILFVYQKLQNDLLGRNAEVTHTTQKYIENEMNVYIR